MAKREIKFTIELDENNMPQSIEWEATDAGFSGKKDCSSMMINLWDPAEKNSMNMHLWTPKMLVSDMNGHFFHNLMHMAETYQKATRNSKLAGIIRNFARQFLAEVKKQS